LKTDYYDNCDVKCKHKYTKSCTQKGGMDGPCETKIKTIHFL